MSNLFLVILSGWILFSPPSNAATCEAAKEFITAFEYLRSDADSRVPETEARDLAFRVAEGCKGSARRFIRVFKALLGVGVDRKDSFKQALRFSQVTDVQTDAFLTVFRSALASDGLDLTLADSLKLGVSLSTEFTGNLDRARKDFEALSLYCGDSDRVGLPKARCADLAAGIVKNSSTWESSISKEWISAFEFLKSSKGPALVTAEALDLAESLVLTGPAGYRDFKEAYLYAISERGLKYTRDIAIVFAKKIAMIRPKNETPEKPREPKSVR